MKYILDNLLEGSIDDMLEQIFGSVYDREDESLIYEFRSIELCI